MTSRRKKIIFATIIAFAGLIVAEVLLQIAALASPRIEYLLAATQKRRIRDEQLILRPDPQHPEHDANGFRNRAVPSEASIVAIGDSQTYGTGVPPEDAWPQQLGKLSGLTTYNMASGGYGAIRYRILLPEAIKLSPELIIVGFYAGNDLADAYKMVYKRGRSVKLRSADPAILDATTEAERQVPLSQRVRDLSTIGKTRSNGRTSPRPSVKNTIYRYSKLFGVLRAVARYYRNAQEVRGSPALWEVFKEEAETHRAYCQIVATERFRTVLTPEYRSFVADLSDPRIREGLRISLQVLREMNIRCKATGIRFAVLLIPTKELVFEKVVGGQPGNVRKTYERLIENEWKLWGETKVFLSVHDIDFIDALPSLRESFDQGASPYKMSRDGHPNAIGHRRIAEAVHVYLTAKNLLER